MARYITLHGYIKNTHTDTKVNAEHQLESIKEDLTGGKEYIRHTKLCNRKEQWRKTRVLVGLYLPLMGGELKQGVLIPTVGII